MSHRVRLFTSVLAGLVCLPAMLFAATYVVEDDGSGDFPTIQAAITAAANGDIILLADGTFTGAGNENLDFQGKAIRLRGQSEDPDLAIIDCGGGGRGAVFDDGESIGTALQYLTIRDGGGDIPGCGIYCDGSSPNITLVKIEDCDSGVSGGAVFLTGGAAPQFASCELRDNTGYSGGAIYAGTGCHFSMSNCTVNSNSSFGGNGGAIYLNGCNPNIEGTGFSYNSAGGGCDGGAIYCNNADPTLDGCTFTGNEGGNSDMGGALYAASGSRPDFSYCNFYSNSAMLGGALYHATGSTLAVHGCQFVGNTATINTARGGAMYMEAVGGTITECHFEYNRAWTGGALFCAAGAYPGIALTTFVDNEAGIGAGFKAQNSDPAFTWCTFATNYAYSSGGAFVADGDSPIFNNVTFYGNAADMALYSGAEPTLDNCIIAFSQGSQTIWFGGTNTPVFTCSDIYGNYGGNWHGYIYDQVGVNGNIEEDPMFCNASQRDLRIHSDSPCAASYNPDCGLIGHHGIGCGETAVGEPGAPGAAWLAVAPNPAPGGTRLHFAAPAGQALRLEVFDVAGRLVRVLAERRGTGDPASVAWDGRDAGGRPAAAGVYFARLSAGPRQVTRRVVLTR